MQGILYIKNIFLSLKIVFILTNSADPDVMLCYTAFHLGLHCLPKYLMTGIQNEKGLLEWGVLVLSLSQTIFL